MRIFPKPSSISGCRCRWLLPAPIVLLLLAPWPSAAKPPEWIYSLPAGVQRGKQATVDLGGSFDHWPPQVHLSGSEGLTVSPLEDAKKKQLVVAAAADAAPGIRWLRLYDEEGATALRPLVVGAVDEQLEAEPNDEPRRPQQVGMPVVVNGRLAKSGDVDGYRVSLKAGETLVASLRGQQWLGSPMDAVLQVCTNDGLTLHQDDDERGLDPLVVWTAPGDGEYLVRVFAFPSKPNSSIAFAGGDTFVYRLTLTSGPFVDHCLPLSVGESNASGPPKAQLYGWNLGAPLWGSDFPAAPARSMLWLGDPRAAGDAMAVRQAAGPSLLAADENAVETPQQIPNPCVVSGHLDSPGEEHAFRISGRKGERVQIRVAAASLGFALDPLLTVVDTAGKVLKELDDASRSEQDPKLDWTFPSDGPVDLWIRDVHGRGGPRAAYRLTLSPATFALSVAQDRFVVAADKPLEITVTVGRELGFAEEIRIQAEGLPEGVASEAVVSEGKGASAKSVKLTLKSTGKAANGPIRIQGVAGELTKTADHTPADSLLISSDLWLTATAR